MKTKELVRDAFLAAILLVLQVSLSWLPNVELVSLLLILYTLVFRRHVWFILYVFVILEGLIYGFGLWWFSYQMCIRDRPPVLDHPLPRGRLPV